MEYPEHLRELIPPNFDLNNYDSLISSTMRHWQANFAQRYAIEVYFVLESSFKEDDIKVLAAENLTNITHGCYSHDELDDSYGLHLLGIKEVEDIDSYYDWFNALSDDGKGLTYDLEAFLRVDLSEPNTKLIEDFTHFLQRKRLEREEDKTTSLPVFSAFTEAKLKSMYENRVLPYWDLMQWAKLNGISITHGQAGCIIFPDSRAGNEESKIRKTTAPLLASLIEKLSFKFLFFNAPEHSKGSECAEPPE